MADVRPFRALRYGEPLEPLLAPPYDVLSEAQVAELRARSPHNVVHVTRPGPAYQGAARLFEEWVAAGTVTESSPRLMLVPATTFQPAQRATGSCGGPGA